MFVRKYISFTVLSLVSYESYIITIYFHMYFFSCHVIFNLMHLLWVQFAPKGTHLLSHPPFLFGVEHSILIFDWSIYCLEVYTVPHFKAPVNSKLEPRGQEHGCIFILQNTRSNIGHLLHISGHFDSQMSTTVRHDFANLRNHHNWFWFIV